VCLGKSFVWSFRYCWLPWIWITVWTKYTVISISSRTLEVESSLNIKLGWLLIWDCSLNLRRSRWVRRITIWKEISPLKSWKHLFNNNFTWVVWISTVICMYYSDLYVLQITVIICIYCSDLYVLHWSVYITVICIYYSDLYVLHWSICITVICMYYIDLYVILHSSM